jgi:hypothetical protein
MEQDDAASTRRRWAVFESYEEGFQQQISRWMEREEAEDILTSLLEGGESCVFLAPQDGPEEGSGR